MVYLIVFNILRAHRDFKFLIKLNTLRDSEFAHWLREKQFRANLNTLKAITKNRKTIDLVKLTKYNITFLCGLTVSFLVFIRMYVIDKFFLCHSYS